MRKKKNRPTFESSTFTSFVIDAWVQKVVHLPFVQHRVFVHEHCWHRGRVRLLWFSTCLGSSVLCLSSSAQMRHEGIDTSQVQTWQHMPSKYPLRFYMVPTDSKLPKPFEFLFVLNQYQVVMTTGADKLLHMR